MSTISTMPSSIVNWLNSQQNLEDINFLTEYPPQYKAVPLKKPVVAVGISNVTISDHFTANENDVLVRDEYCRTAQIEIVLSIHVPFSQGGNRCHEVFTSVVDCLTFASDLNITQSSCDKIVSDRDTEALVMNAKINVTSDFCPAQEVDDNFHSFLDKELLCGSHIRDTDIHITAQERDNWNNRLVVGQYFGTGNSTKSVNLGFKPVFLLVFSHSDPLSSYSQSTLKTENFFAFMIGNNHSHGVEPTSNGFKALNGSTYEISSAVPYLNKLGVTYSFIAVKPI